MGYAFKGSHFVAMITTKWCELDLRKQDDGHPTLDGITDKLVRLHLQALLTLLPPHAYSDHSLRSGTARPRKK